MNFFPSSLRSARLMLALLLSLAIPTLMNATEYYIAPNGSPSGNGSINSPWDIATGLQKSSIVKGGDIVWLRGGTYGTGGSLAYNISLKGSSSSAPVIVRNYRGEHARVNAALKINAPYVWLWGFEVTNTSTKRNVTDINTERPRGVLIASAATGAKVINMVIDNVGRSGVGGGSNNFEVYGTLFWGNGIIDSTVRGDAIYVNMWNFTPDPAAVNQVRDNIGFRNLYAGFKIYSEWAGTYIDGFQLDGNIAFDNGTRGTGTNSQANLLVRSELTAPPIKRLKVTNNFTYRVPESTNPYSVEFGCKPGSGIRCQDAEIRDNHFVTGATSTGAMKINNFDRITATGNTVVGNGNTTLVAWGRDVIPSSPNWDGNRYFRGTSSPFLFSSSRYDFANWRAAANADASGSLSTARPTGVKAVVRKNVYEPGQRANIVIYNWDLKPSVTVDLTPAGMASGAAYEIVDAQNYFGAPVARGTFSSSTPTVTIPMNLTAVSPIVGTVSHITNKHTAPEFGAFILRVAGSGGTVPTQPPTTPTTDTTAPVINITAPAAAATVSGTVNVTVAATDNVGVTKIDYYLDSAATAFASTTSGGPVTWNTTTVANGTHTLRAKAFDAAGNNCVSPVVTVTVNNQTGTVPPPPTTSTTVTLTPTADTFVRDGSYAATAYGTSTAAYIRTSTVDNNRETYFRFDLTSAPTIASAKLRIYAALGGSGSVPAAAYAVASTTWPETSTTWNNRPLLGSQIGTTTINGTTYAWYEIDVTSYVSAQKMAGRNVVSIGLKNPATAGTYTRIITKESSTTKPTLVIRTY